MALIQNPFDFHLLSTNAVGFVPVNLCFTYPSAMQTNIGHTLEFAPTAKPILFANPHYILDSSSHSNGLNFLYFSYYI
jgi:hypothetical protein